MKRAHIAYAICFTVLIVFYLACFHYQGAYVVAITWNKISGEVRLEKEAGFHISPPWVRAAKIDILPMRVGIVSSSRGFNYKLVQFDPDAYREFVAVEGTHYYWLANRISFNFGYNDEYRGMKDILRGYAYSVKKFPFVKVIRDYEESQ